MSERVHHDPVLKVWIIPSDPDDLVPLPALLHSETEHEIIVSEYDRREKCFKLFERERRAKAYREFEACRVAMLQERSNDLEKAREDARNKASIYQHILSYPLQVFPDDAYEAFVQPAEKQEEKEEAVQEEVSAEPEASQSTKRPTRRSRR